MGDSAIEPKFVFLQEIDPKAGGGKPMTMGEMIKSMLVRLEWFDTRFPRIPVNVQVSFMCIICELKKKQN